MIVMIPRVLAAVALIGLLHRLRKRRSPATAKSADGLAELQQRVDELQQVVAAQREQLRHVHQSVISCIGRTPLVRLPADRLGYPHCRATVWAKLEFFNPGGSVKDRIAQVIIERAEARGEITPGVSTLVEATSGNTGLGLAMVAAAKGYKLIVTMPRMQGNLERYLLMRAFGAEVKLVDPALKTQGILDQAEQIVRETPGAYYVSQFTNPDNPDAHYNSTGPEIWEQTQGQVDALVAGVGTGGTLLGAGKFIKTRNSKLHVVAVEPAESRVLQGAKHRPHALLGIGTGLLVPLMEQEQPGAAAAVGARGMVDEFVCASSAESLDLATLTAQQTGLLVGPSSGASIHAALELGSREDFAGKQIVVICASSGVRYLQHPQYKALRDEAAAAFSGKSICTKPMSSVDQFTTAKSGSKLDATVVAQMEQAVLEFVRKVIKVPTLQLTDKPCDHGASSMTAMMLVGSLRKVVEGCGLAVRSLKVAIVKELLWGSVKAMVQALLNIDDEGFTLPCDDGAINVPLFPGLSISGEADETNSGNFLIKVQGSGAVLSPYGFIDTPKRRRALLEKVAALGGGI